MHCVRRSAAGAWIQALVALVLASGGSLFLRYAGPTAMFIVLLAVLFFFALGLLRGILTVRAFRRDQGLGGPGDGPGRGPRPPWHGGTREPRRPFPPRMPPREAAAEFDTTT